MDKIDNEILLTLLKNNGTSVYATESHTLEFKSDFDWADRAKKAAYAKSMAAMCNNEGGYLLFGIEDSTGGILGVNDFDSVDSADISSLTNNYFAPAIIFYKTSIEIKGQRIGIIYIEKYKDIPAICKKEYSGVLKDGAIYFRYPAKSDLISATDLIHLLHQLKGGNSKELVSLEKLKMKQQARPILNKGIGNSSGPSFGFIVANTGNRAKIYDIRITKGNYTLQENKLPLTIEQGESFRIGGYNMDGAVANMAPYELEIYYTDMYENKYVLKAEGRGGAVKFFEPIEIL